MRDGKITKIRKLKKRTPVIDYLKQQKRFQHVVTGEGSKESLMAIQEQADRTIEKYNLLG
jgi:pyruvate/2-oxoacid:ferredoxin oxidoreductase beta subunit